MAFGILHDVASLSDIGANSFAHFQLGASNSEKDNYLKKRKKTLFETNIKMCNMRFEKIKSWEGEPSRKKVITKDYYLNC